MIKCSLFTRKWHEMLRSLIWKNRIWLVEDNSSTWKIAQCLFSAMIGYILNELWTLLSWYVMECTLFGVYVLSQGAEKTRFSLKMIQLMRTFHINLDLNRRGSREGRKPLQLGNLLFQIFVNFQTRALTHKKKKKQRRDQLFQNLSVSWISPYFHFPLVGW